jgi:hypothetical protein
MFVDFILWIAVSILCLRCTNKDNDAENEWKTTDHWIKVLVFLGMPIIYIATAIGEALEK